MAWAPHSRSSSPAALSAISFAIAGGALRSFLAKVKHGKAKSPMSGFGGTVSIRSTASRSISACLAMTSAASPRKSSTLMVRPAPYFPTTSSHRV